MNIEFWVTGFILFFAAFTQGMTGFGFAMVSLSMLSVFMTINEAVPLAALSGAVVNVYLIVKLKHHIDLREVKNLIIGAVIGIPIGSYVLTVSSPELLEFVLGVVIIIFVFLSATKIVKQVGLHKKWGYLFGLSSGILGGSLNTNGPPVLIYFYLHGFDKFKQKASITGFFIFTSAMVVATHAVTGITTGIIFMSFVYHLPFIICGILIGNYYFDKISTSLYNKIILGFLLVMGLFMIFG